MALEFGEWDRIRRKLADEDDRLSDNESLALSRRLTILEPRRAESWWMVTGALDYMLREKQGDALKADPLFTELLHAYDRVIELDPTDAAGPYNKARNLRRAGLLEDAYGAYMLAGQTEAAHPDPSVDWPAVSHFERAAEIAWELGKPSAALAAAQGAIRVGAVSGDEHDLLHSWRDDWE